MKIAAVIFDWAGTMIDYGSLAPVIAMRHAFEAERVPVTDDEIRSGMGLAKRDHVAAVLSLPRVAAAWNAAHAAAPAQGDIERIFHAIEPLMQAAGVERARLIPGATAAIAALRARGVKIGSTTGYTRAMMTPILAAAQSHGYTPDCVICAGETPAGRPAPYMIWKALTELEVWPTSAAVNVDDAPVGVAAGKNAGCFTIGVAASGNAMGLDAEQFAALTASERAARLSAARLALLAAGADAVVDTVADLPATLGARGLL